MRETEMLRLEEICKQAKVPLLVVRSYGLVGYLRVRTTACLLHLGLTHFIMINLFCHAASLETFSKHTNTSPWKTVQLSQGLHVSLPVADITTMLHDLMLI